MLPSTVFDEAWKEQLARLRRWYERTTPISRDRASISEEEVDLLFAFFLNCWHLYDWLKNSNALPTLLLDEFFRNDETMRICYDICIGAKHLRIDRPKAGLSALVRGVEYMGEKIGEVPTQLFLFKGGTQSLTILADVCMSKIEGFLRDNNLS